MPERPGITDRLRCPPTVPQGFRVKRTQGCPGRSDCFGFDRAAEYHIVGTIKYRI